MEAEAGGQKYGALLQNAETVRLVGPRGEATKGQAANSKESVDWRAIPVTELQKGDQLLLHRQEGARHTGVAIQETIIER